MKDNKKDNLNLQYNLAKNAFSISNGLFYILISIILAPFMLIFWFIMMIKEIRKMKIIKKYTRN